MASNVTATRNNRAAVPPAGVNPQPSANRALNLYNVAQQQSAPQERDVGPAPVLKFLSVNRVVAVIEKAVERLELLSLLDTTAPPDGPGPLFPSIGGTAAAAASEAKKNTSSLRKAALLSHRQDEPRKMVREVNAALQSAASAQWSDRPTVADLVAEQQQIEMRYSELLQKTAKVRPNPNEPELDRRCFSAVRNEEQAAVLEELKQTSRLLREHNKALFIQLKDNPNDADNWRKVGNERKELIQLLQAVVSELTTGYSAVKPSSLGVTTQGLRTSMKYRAAAQSDCPTSESKEGPLLRNRFGSIGHMQVVARGQASPRIPLTSSFEAFAKLIADEQSAQRWADEIVLKEKELNQNVKQLQHDLKAEKLLKEKDVAERRERVAALHIQLRQEKKRVQEQNEMIRAEVEAAHEAMQRQASDEERVVLDAMRTDEQELIMENLAHVDFTEHLIERTEAMDELAMQWEKKNQVEIKRVEARKIDVDQMRQQCAERLQKAHKDKETELSLKEARDNEQNKIESEKNALEQQTNLEYAAVSKIQSAIKAMFTRQALIVLKKKNKRKRKQASS